MADLHLERTAELLAKALEARESVTIICYTTFGIVRGSFKHSSDSTVGRTPFASAGESDLVIRLHETVVEHYSSHLPTGLYPVFYLSLKEVSGYVLLPPD